MIWIIALVLGGSVLLALKASGQCPRGALEIGAVAVLIALAGYSWQGKPDMPGHPVSAPASD